MPAENVGNLQWAIQGSQGTPASAGVYASYLAGGSMVRGTGENADFEETTGEQLRSGRYVVERHAEGTPEFIARPNVAASLLYGVLGAVATAGASDPYTHTITKAVTRPYFTFWRSQGALIYEELSDCKIDQLVISGESGRPVRLAATIMGLRPRHQTAEETTATIETTFPHVFYHGDGALQVEGSAVASIGSFSCTINRNAELIGGDSVIPIENAEGLLTIETEFSRLWASAALPNRVSYGASSPSNDTEIVSDILTLGSEPSLDFKFTAQASPERSIQLQLRNNTIDPYEIPIGTGGAPVRESIIARTVEPTSGEAITAIVLNALDDLVSPS